MGELRAFVLRRDRQCLLRTLRYPGHICYARWSGESGMALARGDQDYSLGHLTQVHSHLDVRRDDDAHCVAQCLVLNLKPPSHDEAQAMRSELRRIHPECAYY
jgi:hypothetical protein